jgi:signal transduction histidine kinase
LLLLSRTGRVSAERTDVPLAALLDEIIGQFGRRLADENARLIIAPDLPLIRADRKGMVRVFTNLIDNALKYRHPGIATCIDIGWLREEGELKLFVRDNGIGIRPEYHERIFGLFQRAHTQVEGTGVGLAISKRVIEVHGGRMWVESKPDSGSTFWIGLPRSLEVG